MAVQGFCSHSDDIRYDYCSCCGLLNRAIRSGTIVKGTSNNVARLRRATRRGNSLSCPDRNLDAWIEALRVLPVAPVTEDNVLAWVEGPLRHFFPFDRFLGCYGKLAGGRIQMVSLVSSGYTTEFLSRLESSFDLNARGCFAWWVSNRKPFMLHRAGAFDGEENSISASERELDEVRRFSLGVVAAHGVIDPFANAGTYVSFSGVPRIQPKHTLAALELIAPVLHTLFLQTKHAKKSSIDLTVLTDRQRELVDLALVGLSDKAMAKRLAISDHTVGNHFRAIYAKLGISKRAQLIALLK
jgi:DNA-binding CsgD family transcriptional regulator